MDLNEEELCILINWQRDWILLRKIEQIVPADKFWRKCLIPPWGNDFNWRVQGGYGQLEPNLNLVETRDRKKSNFSRETKDYFLISRKVEKSKSIFSDF